MKKIGVLILLFLSLSLYGGISPESLKVGAVDAFLEKGSLSSLAAEAFQSEFSLEWLEKYTINTEPFILAYSPELSSRLPMKSLVVGKEKENRLSLYSQEDGLLITLVFEDGKISAIDFQ